MYRVQRAKANAAVADAQTNESQRVGLMKREAENLAAEASGVRDVHNRIRVDDGSASAGRPGEAIRSGRDQLGSGFSSSDRPDPVYDNMQQDSNWPGRNWPGQ